MSASAQPIFDSAVTTGPATPTAEHVNRMPPQSTVIALVASARAAHESSFAPRALPASVSGHSGALPHAPVATAIEMPAPAPAPAADSMAAELQAVSPVADQKTLLQFVASTKPAEDDAPVADSSAVACVIPQSITFKGEASFPCDAVIEGEFDGTLRVGPNARVTIAAAGMVEGSVYGQSVHVDGSVSGEVHAIGGLASFGPKAFCSGQIHYTRLSIAEGAEIEASMKRVPQAV